MRRIYLSPPHMSAGERQLLCEAFDSNWIAPVGPHVDAFEMELAAYVGVRHAAALSSGTAALHLALVVLGAGPGDEVWTSTLTFAATANAITYVGATPVFFDSERTSWNLDTSLVAEALDQAAKCNRLPKAVIPVDLYGQCPDYGPLLAACARYDVPVIEDAAEGLGARFRHRAAGSFGQMAVVSFNGNKILTTSGGGMLLSNDPASVERARFLATQALDPAPHYEHSTVGYNYRLSNLLAAVGRGQLSWVDDRIEMRRENNRHYRELLEDQPGLDFLREAPWGRSTHWLTCLQIDPDARGEDREAVRKRLAAAGIESRAVWKPMHLQPAFRGCRAVAGAVARELFERGLCLPSGSNLEHSDRERIAEIVRAGPT